RLPGPVGQGRPGVLRYVAGRPSGRVRRAVHRPAPVLCWYASTSGTQEPADPAASAVRRVHRRGAGLPGGRPVAGGAARGRHGQGAVVSRPSTADGEGRHRFETVSSQDIYQGRVIALRADEVRMPGGKVARREVVEHYGAVAIAALDEDRRLTMINQYRHPFGQRLWELPAGLLDEPDEAPVDTAARELAEEAGVAAQRWEVLVDVAASPGFTDE